MPINRDPLCEALVEQFFLKDYPDAISGCLCDHHSQFGNNSQEWQFGSKASKTRTAARLGISMSTVLSKELSDSKNNLIQKTVFNLKSPKPQKLTANFKALRLPKDLRQGEVFALVFLKVDAAIRALTEHRKNVKK